MEQILFAFALENREPEALMSQLRTGLEKRTENISRERYPDLWKRTDKINAMTGGKKRSRLRTRIMSAICLILGIVLFVPGLVEPELLTVPLIIGALAIGAGIGGLWRSRKGRKDPFLKAAEKMLSDRQEFWMDGLQLLFGEEEMLLTGEQVEEMEVPYGLFECAVETEELFLLFFDEQVMLTHKQDLRQGDVDAFRRFLGAKTRLWQTETQKS